MIRIYPFIFILLWSSAFITTKPIIDNVSMVDFIMRRGRDKSKINLFPCASLTKQMEGKLMTEFGLLSAKGIIGFSDVNKTVQNTETMARIMTVSYTHLRAHETQ